MLVRMDERQKLVDELARYLTLRNLTTDDQAREAIDERIRDIENRLEGLDQKADSYSRHWS
jgi:hypothetical protein